MFFIAPVQGHTDAAWRHFHALEYDCPATYFTPFIRIEQGEARRHDLRDFTSHLNDNIDVIPQVIFRDMTELLLLAETLTQHGAKRIDLNMGCPFPLQTRKGRGAGILSQPDALAGLPDLANKFPGTTFTVKMRLGFDQPDQWRDILPIVNRLKPAHITIHPRTAKQQYKGELDLEQFKAILDSTDVPVIFNGELRTPKEIDNITSRFPSIAGIMCARGILGRPSLFEEHKTGHELPLRERVERMKQLHDKIIAHYAKTLCGEAQILSKIKPFWEYAKPEIGHKALKAINKATTLAKYHAALTST